MSFIGLIFYSERCEIECHVCGFAIFIYKKKKISEKTKIYIKFYVS